MIDLSYIITAVVSAAAGIWYGRRWGFDDGHAEGYDKGLSDNAMAFMADKRATDAAGIGSGVRNQAMTGGPGRPQPAPQAGGGPGVPE